MKINKLAPLVLTTTVPLAGGAAFAADTSSQSGSGQTSTTGNGQANSAAEAGQTAPDAHQNMAPKGVDNSQINTGSTQGATGNTSSSSGSTMGHMSKDEVHKNTMCKDGRCPDINKKVETGNGSNNDANTKTDGTTQ